MDTPQVDPNATPQASTDIPPSAPPPIPAPGTNNAPLVATPPSAQVSLTDAVADGKPVSTLAPANQADLFTKADVFYKDAVEWLGGLKEDAREKVQMVMVGAGHRWREAVTMIKNGAAVAEKALEEMPATIKAWTDDDAKAVADVAATAPEMDALGGQIQALEKQYDLEFVNRSHSFTAPPSQQKVFEGKMKGVPIPFKGIGLTWTEALTDLEKQLTAYEANFKK